MLAERERVIDALYLEVEHLASREVLLQAPAADLRFLLSVLRVTPELERSHDLVMQAADRVGLAAPGGASRPCPRARHADGRPRRQEAVPAAMEMTLVAHCYQRLGAHAVNIARRAAYLAGPADG